MFEIKEIVLKNYYAGQIWHAGLTLPPPPLIQKWSQEFFDSFMNPSYLVTRFSSKVFQNPRPLLILGLMSIMDCLLVALIIDRLFHR